MPKQKCPLWMTLLIIALCLPLFAFPTMLSLAHGREASTFIWLYPAYVVASGICAWLCYPSRKEVTWILLVILVLTHAAMWMLVTNDSYAL